MAAAKARQSNSHCQGRVNHREAAAAGGAATGCAEVWVLGLLHMHYGDCLVRLLATGAVLE